VLAAASRQDEKFFSQFKDKICIIGPTTRSIGDFYATPMQASSPGYITHASFYDTIVTNNFIHRASGTLQFILLLVLTFIIGIVAQLSQTRIGVSVSLAIITLYILFAYFSFASANTWYNVVEPLFATIVCFGSTVAYRAATEGKQKKMITGMFERYVDKTVVQNLISNPAMLRLGGETREITLLFSDIKGFTTISEKIPPEVLVKLLNSYLTEMTNIIMRNRGTVDKFIGDAIMAFWGAPLPDENAAYNACVSALEMQDRLDKLQTKIRKYGDIEIRQRVGLNTGVCIVGNMGSESKFNYTAMGDPVNLASRLEGTNKQYGTAILISEFTHSLVPKKIVAREVDRVQVVGKTEPVRIYELIQLADKPVSTNVKQFLEAFQEGVKCYQSRKWDEGIAYMEHAMGFVPNDPVCQIYIERMKLFQIHPPEPNWNGVFVLATK
ncbi:MAG: adenylate/guanylate cyclase domain-containing protein, partial [Ignavibacteriales bacterium]|nr:adenylate/guanylate cyclase domain-containing protein [Ignavibacteriales bacterium]